VLGEQLGPKVGDTDGYSEGAEVGFAVEMHTPDCALSLETLR
jgi:hypothetical protein